MSLSKPTNPVFITETNSPAPSTGLLGVMQNATLINQLHGIATTNAVGAGIPKQVSGVQVSIANAQTGSTCTVSVLYSIDPTDKNFAGVNIWVKGYQGNNQLVQVASGVTAPTKFVLNNTGENVSFTVQAYGNGGSAPLTGSPTCSGKLPQSTAGGFGSSAVTAPSSTAVFKTNGVVNSVQTLLNLTGIDESVRLAADSSGDVDFSHKVFYTSFLYPQFNAGNYVESPQTSLAFGSGGVGTPTVTVVGASASLPAYIKHTTPASTGNAVTVYGTNSHLRLDIIKSAKARLLHFDNTNVRNWIGMSDSTLPQGGAFQSDTPNQNFVGFRFSTAASDTHWQAVCSTDSTHQTLVDTGITPDTTSFHVYEVRTVAGTPGTVLFYIDHVQVASISTNVPTSSTGLNPLVWTETRTTATRSVGVTVLSYEHFS